MNKKGFCVAPFRNAEFQSNGLVWQCCSGYWSDEEKRSRVGCKGKSRA